MIIGNNNKNNFNPFSNFKPKYKEQLQENNKEKQNTINQQTHSQRKPPMKNYNITSKKEMTEKSIQMLQERYNNGLISIEEFKKKCDQLRKHQ